MSRFAPGPVTVQVPATSANLGPGFDCLGLALELHDTLTGEVVDSGLVIEMDGEGADVLPRDDRHLVVQAMRAGFAALGVAPPGLALRAVNRIPQSRGLGSSSAAIIGGLALARGLVVDPETAPIAVRAFTLFVETRQLKSVRDYLEAMTGKHWSYDKTRRLLTNKRSCAIANTRIR